MKFAGKKAYLSKRKIDYANNLRNQTEPQLVASEDRLEEALDTIKEVPEKNEEAKKEKKAVGFKSAIDEAYYSNEEVDSDELDGGLESEDDEDDDMEIPQEEATGMNAPPKGVQPATEKKGILSGLMSKFSKKPQAPAASAPASQEAELEKKRNYVANYQNKRKAKMNTVQAKKDSLIDKHHRNKYK